MRIIRWFVGKIILALDAIFSPKVRELTMAQQKKINEASGNLALYQFEACPFCVKVRRVMKAEGIHIPLIDSTTEPGRGELLKGGGKLQAPCLKITKKDGTAEWMYESNDIISYLKNTVAVSS